MAEKLITLKDYFESWDTTLEGLNAIWEFYNEQEVNFNYTINVGDNLIIIVWYIYES